MEDNKKYDYNKLLLEKSKINGMWYITSNNFVYCNTNKENIKKKIIRMIDIIDNNNRIKHKFKDKLF